MRFGKPDILIGLMLVLLIAVVYGQVRHHGFIHFDDDVYITGNPYVRSGLTVSGVTWAFTTTHAEFWHPLTWLSHMLDVHLFELNSGLHHLSSLLLHVLNALLLYAALSAMTGMRMAPAAVATLFALHPLHVESVAWAAERKDVLSTFFGFGCLGVYARYARRPGWVRYMAMMFLFVCSLAAKPMLVTLPFLLLLFDYWPLERIAKGSGSDSPDKSFFPWFEKLPLIVISLVFVWITFRAQRQTGYLMPLDAVPPGDRIANALVSYMVYLGKTVWPHPLAILYPRPETVAYWQGIAAGFFLLAVSGLVLKQVRIRPWLATGWFWFLISLVPVIGLVQISTFSHADRYTYVPLTGLFIILAWGAADLIKRWWIRKSVIVVLAVLLSAGMTLKTRNQVALWRDSHTLFTHALEVTSGNYMAHAALGMALAETGRFDEALAHYQEAIRLKPDYAVAYNNLGIVHLYQGETEAAILEFRRAVELKPDYGTALSNLGAALVHVRLFDEAAVFLDRAVKADPLDAGAFINLAAAMANTGRTERAADHLQKAIELEPDHPTAHLQMGRLMMLKGDMDQARRHFLAVPAQVPEHAQARFLLERIRGSESLVE